METELEIKDLNVEFNSLGETKQVLHDISIRVCRNRKIGIIGESGSGKTQTVLSILGLIEGKPGVVSGNIQFKNRSILNSNELNCKDWKEFYENRTQQIRGHEASIIFQDAKASLIPYQTIEEQAIETWKALNGNDAVSTIVEKAALLLKEMKLSDTERVLKSYPNQLSGGECQRAYIMLALLGSPSLLIADEPTSSLDRKNADILLKMINNLCDLKDISLILISHDLRDVIENTDYVYVFFNGNVIEEFSIESYSSDNGSTTPSHPYSKFLLSMADGRLIKQLKNDPKSVPLFENGAKNNFEDKSTGCPYYNYCELRKSQSEEKQRKCMIEKPRLRTYLNENKSACWYDK